MTSQQGGVWEGGVTSCDGCLKKRSKGLGEACRDEGGGGEGVWPRVAVRFIEWGRVQGGEGLKARRNGEIHGSHLFFLSFPILFFFFWSTLFNLYICFFSTFSLVLTLYK